MVMPKKNNADHGVPVEPENNAAEAEKAETEMIAEQLDKIADLTAELSSEKEKYLRLAAEYDNYRKRCMKERDGLYADVKSDTVCRFLPVYDNLERALQQGTEDLAFKKGIEMTMAQLIEIFESLGVAAVTAVGAPFDPAIHHAVLHVEDGSVGENTVVEEFQKGFRLGDKIIRFSMVKVAN